MTYIIMRIQTGIRREEEAGAQSAWKVSEDNFAHFDFAANYSAHFFFSFIIVVKLFAATATAGFIAHERVSYYSIAGLAAACACDTINNWEKCVCLRIDCCCGCTTTFSGRAAGIFKNPSQTCRKGFFFPNEFNYNWLKFVRINCKYIMHFQYEHCEKSWRLRGVNSLKS